MRVVTAIGPLARHHGSHRQVEPTLNETVILEQYYLGCLAHASYLVADETSGTAAVVDPQRDVGRLYRHCREARAHHSLRVPQPLPRRLRGGPSRASRPRRRDDLSREPGGSRVRLPRLQRPSDALELGPTGRLEVLETPGHSPESISILVYDSERDSDEALRGSLRRHALHRRRRAPGPASGARVDCRGARAARSTTRFTRKLLPLPDETLVYPAHGAGSLCGKNLSTDTVSTIGVQRRYNYALQPMTKDEFVRIVTADQPDSPAYFTYDAILNTKERPTLEETLEETLHPLSLDELLAFEAAGCRSSTFATRPISRERIFGGASISASAEASPPGREPCSIPVGQLF